MTQIEAARKNIITRQMIEVAEDEGFAPEEIRALVASGEVVIPHNLHHDFAGGDQRANFLGRETFVLGNFGHLPGNNIFAGGLYLSHRVTSAAGESAGLGSLSIAQS